VVVAKNPTAFQEEVAAQAEADVRYVCGGHSWSVWCSCILGTLQNSLDRHPGEACGWG
jgi:enterochelin esterase-like enzyme